MKNLKLSLLIALAAFAVSLSSCKKDDNSPKLKSFSFPTSTDLTVELTWTVNGQTAGNNYVDLDLDIYTWDGTTYSSKGSSGTGSSFESATLLKSAANYSATLGINYYGNESGLSSLSSPYTIAYTIKVYPVGNVGAAQTYTGTITNPTTTPNNQLLYNQMSVTKNSSTFSFTELATKTTFDYSNTLAASLQRSASQK